MGIKHGRRDRPKKRTAWTSGGRSAKAAAKLSQRRRGGVLWVLGLWVGSFITQGAVPTVGAVGGPTATGRTGRPLRPLMRLLAEVLLRPKGEAFLKRGRRVRSHEGRDWSVFLVKHINVTMQSSRHTTSLDIWGIGYKSCRLAANGQASSSRGKPTWDRNNLTHASWSDASSRDASGRDDDTSSSSTCSEPTCSPPACESIHRRRAAEETDAPERAWGRRPRMRASASSRCSCNELNTRGTKPVPVRTPGPH